VRKWLRPAVVERGVADRERGEGMCVAAVVGEKRWLKAAELA
jgi:hypothetical protein